MLHPHFILHPLSFPHVAPLSDELRAKWLGDKGKQLTFAQTNANAGGLIATTVRDADGCERELKLLALTHLAQQWPNVKRRRFNRLESLESEEALLRAGGREIQG